MGEQMHAQSFARAESDTYVDALLDGVPLNTWHHRREPTTIDAQDVIRMNRDTL